MTGLQKFLVCLLSVVVAVSLGVTVYYFARTSDEVLSLTESTLYENTGDEFTVTIKQEHADKHTTLKLESDNNAVVEYVSKKDLSYTFKAKAAGIANIVLITSNEKYNKEEKCVITVRDGTASNPYVVRTSADLTKIGNEYGLDKSYEQVANIDMKGVTFSPIGPTDANSFTGVYNGANFKISNLELNSNAEYAGLFGVVASTATVKDVIVDNANFKGTATYVAGIAAKNSGNVYGSAVQKSTLESTAAGSYVGGVVAWNLSSVKTSSFDGNINKGDTLGGVVANNDAANVQECYARGVFTPSDSSRMGGVVALNQGSNNTMANVVNCYSTMTNSVAANTNIGMILFTNRNYDNSIALSNENSVANRVYGNYYEAGNTTYKGIYSFEDDAKFVSKFVNKASKDAYVTYAANGDASTWNFKKIWSLSSTTNNGYPTLQDGAYPSVGSIYIPGITPSDPDEPITPVVIDAAKIDTKEKLMGLDNQGTVGSVTYSWDGNYFLGADIDLGGAEWTPMAFSGTLDGKGHKIYNFTVKEGTDDNTGFTSVLTGVIKNLTLENVTISSSTKYAGVVAGTNEGQIYNVTANNISGNVNNEYFGALVAYNKNSITKGYVTNLAVTSSAKFFGGVIGYNAQDVVVKEVSAINDESAPALTATNAYRFGGVVADNLGYLSNAKTNISYNITAAESAWIGGVVAANYTSAESLEYSGKNLTVAADAGKVYLGGIVGYTQNKLTDAVVQDVTTITQTGNAEAYVGGIAGCAYGAQAKVSGSVSGATIVAASYAGGIAGNVDQKATISTSGATGSVTAKYVGGLVSIIRGDDSSIVNSFAKSVITGSDSTAGMAYRLDGGKISNCYIAAAFGSDAKGKYYETTTAIRDGKGGDVSNNLINDDVMKNAQRQYCHSINPLKGYINVPVVNWEFNAPDDNLHGNGYCKDINNLSKKGWDTNIWTIFDGQPHINGLLTSLVTA